MLPQNAIVFFVNADGVRDSEFTPAAIAQVSVKIFDVTHAIASELQAVGTHPHSIFAYVKCILADLRRPWISIGNDHLGEGCTVKHGALPAMIGITYITDLNTPSRIEANNHRPVLPADARALQREARPFRLRDVQRLEFIPQISNTIRRIVGRLWRQRPLPMLFLPNHLHPV